jgi:cysteine desulfurase / selenocysteine lyase
MAWIAAHAVVAVSSVQFSTGSMVDVPRLREACARAGARLIVDATQAAGILKIDSQRWKADAVVTSGYKWLGGHGGVALSAVSPHSARARSTASGLDGNDRSLRLRRHSAAFRRRRSTLHAVDDVLHLDGRPIRGARSPDVFRRNRLEAHSRSLSRRLIQGLHAYGWTPFRALEDASASPHIVSLAHPDVGADRAIDALASPRHRLWRSQRPHQGLARAVQQQ